MTPEDVEYLREKIHSPEMQCRQCDLIRELLGTAWLRVPHDYCLHRSGLDCGGKEADHPLQIDPFGKHEFKPGAKTWVRLEALAYIDDDNESGREMTSWL